MRRAFGATSWLPLPAPIGDSLFFGFAFASKLARRFFKTRQSAAMPKKNFEPQRYTSSTKATELPTEMSKDWCLNFVFIVKVFKVISHFDDVAQRIEHIALNVAPVDIHFHKNVKISLHVLIRWKICCERKDGEVFVVRRVVNDLTKFGTENSIFKIDTFDIKFFNQRLLLIVDFVKT